MNSLVNINDVAERAPKPIRSVGAHALLSTTKMLGQNHIRYSHNGKIFSYQYLDRQTLRRFFNSFSEGCIRPENIPIDVFDVSDKHDALFDLGANFGTYSVPLGVFNPATPLYCFEPDEYNQAVIRANIDANDLTEAKVIDAVAARTSGTVPWYTSIDNTVAHTTTPRKTQSYDTSKKQAIALSEFCAERGIRSPWLKIDIEGAEIDVLEDLVANSDFEAISGWIEIHENREKISVRRVRDLLADLGAESELLDSSSNLPIYSFSTR